MKQGDDLPRPGIDPGDIRPLVAVARVTGQKEIASLCRSEMLLGNDMIDFEWQSVVGLRNLTSFAAFSGAPPHQVS
jgi:hypothetical protein